MTPRKPNSKIRFFYFAPPIFWMGCIFCFSTDLLAARRTGPATHSLLLQLFPFLTKAAIDVAHIAVRKLAHVSEYALLALLWQFAWTKGASATVRRAALLAAILSVGYAALDEWHQTFTRERQGTAADVLVDSIGVCLVTIFALWKASSAKRTQTPRTW